MFRAITTIGFICLSVGSNAAAEAPNPNSIENSKIKKALVALLNERASWGTSAVAAEGKAASRIALKEYLARRESWGSAPTFETGSANANALTAYLARRQYWGSAPALVTATANANALTAYLARRDNWNSRPASALAENRTALAAYLARRDSWSTERSATVAENRRALENYLTRRSSWGSGPASNVAASRRALQFYLAQRASWGQKPAVAADKPNAVELSAYLARRDSWGKAPSDTANTTAAVLKRHLAERASWGSRPTLTSAEANRVPIAHALTEYLDRRSRWNEASATRVAAFAMTRPKSSNAAACTEAMHQIASFSGINFEFDSVRLTKGGSGMLQQVAAAARDCTGLRIRIEGHTDSLGDDARNQALSEARAAAVADYLQEAGMSGDALVAIGFGESQPLLPNTTRANRAQNRRIELRVLAN